MRRKLRKFMRKEQQAVMVSITPPFFLWEARISYFACGEYAKLGRIGSIPAQQKRTRLMPLRETLVSEAPRPGAEKKLEARGVEPLSSKLSTQASTCLSDGEF